MKNRKQRSDKGTIKGQRRKPGVNDEVAEDGNDETMAGPSKRRKLATKSRQQQRVTQQQNARQQQRARKIGEPRRPKRRSFL